MRRAAKAHRVVLERLPLDAQQVAAGVLDRTPQLVAAESRLAAANLIAPANAASKSVSRPGTTAICAISTIIARLPARNPGRSGERNSGHGRRLDGQCDQVLPFR